MKQGDNYNDGCYNLDCPGFVQTSSEIAIDAVVSYKGDRFGVQVIVLQVPSSSPLPLMIPTKNVSKIKRFDVHYFSTAGPSY